MKVSYCHHHRQRWTHILLLLSLALINSEAFVDNNSNNKKKKTKKPEKVIPKKKTSFAEVFEGSNTKPNNDNEEKRQRLRALFQQQQQQQQQSHNNVDKRFHQKADNHVIRSLFTTHRKSGGDGGGDVTMPQDIGGGQGAGISDTHDTGLSEHKPVSEWVVEGSDTKETEEKVVDTASEGGGGGNLFSESKAEKEDESQPIQVSGLQKGESTGGKFSFLETQEEKDNAEQIAGIPVSEGKVASNIEDMVETQQQQEEEDVKDINAEQVAGIPEASEVAGNIEDMVKDTQPVQQQQVSEVQEDVKDINAEQIAGIPASDAAGNIEAYGESDPVQVQGLANAKPAGQFDFVVSENEKSEVEEISGIPAASDTATNIEKYVDSEPVQVTGLTKGKTETGSTSKMVNSDQETQEVDDIVGIPASDTAEKIETYANDNSEPVKVTGLTKAHKETGASSVMVSNQEKDEIQDLAGFPASETANELEAFANDQPVHVDGLSTAKETGKFDYLISNQEKEEVEAFSGIPASDTAGELDTYAVEAQGPVKVDGLTKGHKETGAFSEVMSEEQKTTVTNVAGFPASKTASELSDYAKDQPANVPGLSSAKATGDFGYLVSENEKEEVQEIAAFPASKTASEIEGYADDQPVHVAGVSNGKEENGKFSYLVSNQEKEDVENMAAIPAPETASELEDYAKSQPVEVTGLTKAHKETGAISSMYGEEEKQEAEEFAAFPASDVASELEDYANSQPVEVTGLTKAHKETGAISSMYGEEEKKEAEEFAAFPASDVASNVQSYAKSQPATVPGLSTAKATGNFDYLESEQEKSEAQEIAGFHATASANEIHEFAVEVQNTTDSNLYGDAKNNGTNPQDLNGGGGIRTYGVYVPESAAKAASEVDHVVFGKDDGDKQASDATVTNAVADSDLVVQNTTGGGNLFNDAQNRTQSTQQYEPLKHDYDFVVQNTTGGGNLFNDAQNGTQSTQQYEPLKHDYDFVVQNTTGGGNLFNDAQNGTQSTQQYEPLKHDYDFVVQNTTGGNLFNDAQNGTQSTQQQEPQKEHGHDVQNNGEGEGNLFSSAHDAYTATDGKDTSSATGAKPGYLPSMLSMWDEWWTKPFCGDDELEIQMFLETDTWSDLEAGMLVYELTSKDITFIEPGDIPSDTVVNDQVCTVYDACYEFYFFDTWGDGFMTGGLYLNAGGVNVLDIRPQSEGHFDSLQFWGVYFGGACEDIYGSIFGELDSINEDIVINITTHNVDPAPLFLDETSESCGIGTDTIMVEMDFTVDEYSIFDNGIALHDVNASGFFWYYEEGSFVEAAGTEYTWSRCLDAFVCNEFLLYDSFGNGIFREPGVLSLLVNGEEALLVEANEAATAHTDSPHPDATLYSVLIGNCPDDYGDDFTS